MLVSEGVVAGDYQNRLIQVKIIHQLRLLWEVLLLDEHILEEADIIIIAQAIYAAKETCIAIVANDTDVYMLLLYHYQAELLTVSMRLQSTQSGRAVIDIALSKACTT